MIDYIQCYPDRPLLDSTPAFQGVGAPSFDRGAKGGTNILIGIGLTLTASTPGRWPPKWMAAAIDDE